jgi:hypothetical protein
MIIITLSGVIQNQDTIPGFSLPRTLRIRRTNHTEEPLTRISARYSITGMYTKISNSLNHYQSLQPA